MNDLVNTDIAREIAKKLIVGESLDIIAKELCCELSQVCSVLQSDQFSAMSMTILDNKIKGLTPLALQNIVNIATDEKASTATRLKANMFIVDKAMDLKGVGGGDVSPANMTQDALVKTLDALQEERAKRATPVDTEEITPSIDDMM